jgi:hypothetical protein
MNFKILLINIMRTSEGIVGRMMFGPSPVSWRVFLSLYDASVGNGKQLFCSRGEEVRA